jgi:hypothetical protein
MLVNFQYRIRKISQPASVLCQVNPLYLPRPYFPNIHVNIILPSMNRSSRFSFPWGFRTKILCAVLIFPMRITFSAHCILLDLLSLVMYLAKEYDV